MSSKGKDLFVTPPEIVEWVRDLVVSLGEHVVLYRGPREALRHWDGSAEALLSSSRAMFTGELANLDGVSARDYAPGLLGWVVVGLPRTAGPCLYLVSLAGKSDWYDEALRKVLEKPDALKRYDRIWRRWKPRVSSPMLVRHIPSGAARLYSNVGYSAGAAEWVRHGGILRQEGTANNEYLIPGSNA